MGNEEDWDDVALGSKPISEWVDRGLGGESLITSSGRPLLSASSAWRDASDSVLGSSSRAGANHDLRLVALDEVERACETAEVVTRGGDDISGLSSFCGISLGCS